MSYDSIVIAYCYSLEIDAAIIVNILRKHNFRVEAVSCTVGGIAQNDVNLSSNNCNVSCNPIGQARQLNSKKTDLVLTVGLCLGHDILFNREIKSNVTNLIVKDRVFNHQPSQFWQEMKNKN